MSDAELHAETLRIQEHVRRHQVGDASTELLLQAFQNIEAELLQRDADKPVKQLQAEAKALGAALRVRPTGTTADELGQLRLGQLQDSIAARAYLPEVGTFALGPGVIEKAIENGTESRLVEPLSLQDPDQDIESWDLESLQVEGARIRFWLAFHRDTSDQRYLEMTDLLHRIEAEIVQVMILEVGEAQQQDAFVDRVRGAQLNGRVADMLKVRPNAQQNRILFWEGLVPLWDAMDALANEALVAAKPVLMAADVVLGFVPIVGEVLSAVEAVVGYDLAGNELSNAERWMLAASAIPIAGKAARVLKIGARLTTLGAHAAAGLTRIGHAISAAVKISEAGEKGMLAIARACSRARRSVAEVIPLLSRLGALSMHQGAIAEAVRLLRSLEPLTKTARRGILAVGRVFGRSVHLAEEGRALDRIIGDGRRVSGFTGFLKAPRMARREFLHYRDTLKALGHDLVRHGDKLLDRYGKAKGTPRASRRPSNGEVQGSCVHESSCAMELPGIKRCTSSPTPDSLRRWAPRRTKNWGVSRERRTSSGSSGKIGVSSIGMRSGMPLGT
jgi:hypothetical protein